MTKMYMFWTLVTFVGLWMMITKTGSDLWGMVILFTGLGFLLREQQKKK